ncbi:hypothetical protein AGMMS50222_06530 [Endomicrobiia bacterium]|nr:hypothetical protein AGMMS50222_06530 [Endomicrobiia bacterium]
MIFLYSALELTLEVITKQCLSKVSCSITDLGKPSENGFSVISEIFGEHGKNKVPRLIWFT